MRLSPGSEEDTARTLFPDQTIVTVIGVVCITKSSMTVFEFEEFVAVFSGVASAGEAVEVRNSQETKKGSRRPH